VKAPTSSLFGTGPKPESTSLFGGESKTTGLFAPTNSLWGSTKAEPVGKGAGLFGASATPSTGLFGQPSGSLFGKPAAGTSLFGNSAAPSTGLFGKP